METTSKLFLMAMVATFDRAVMTASTGAAEFPSSDVTFNEHVARIVHDKCTRCHRPGQSGPFSLITFDDVSSRAETIRAVLDAEYMPPWKPISTDVVYTNDRRLAEEEKTLFRRWLDAGCPEGATAAAPTPPEYSTEWTLGEPDLVIEMPEPFSVPADGPDVYRSFVFPADLPEDKWVSAIEFRPTARGAVHHALFFVDVGGAARGRRDGDGQPGFRGMSFLRRGGNALKSMPENLARGLGGYVPGAMPNRLPGDLARLLPAHSDIIVQTHFHPTGKPETEQARLGLYFASQPPKKRLVPIQVPALFGIGAGIDVPAGVNNYRVEDSYVLPVDVMAYEIGGHAHYICREMAMTATLPDGTERHLLKIDDWDLDWQDQYQFGAPIALPAGTKLTTVLVYDNSSANPENPYQPPRRIQWGRESTDEMGSVTLLVTAADEADRPRIESDVRDRAQNSIRQRIRSQVRRFGGFGAEPFNGALVKLLDRNRDGSLQQQELPARGRDRLLDLMDSNGDDTIDAQELEAGRQLIRDLTREE
ncbi:MAG: hypothetical protein R3E01_07965 [Pirellulaceae bacterium]|nr:hypothetical protein [Planctomycetales bacterium]